MVSTRGTELFQELGEVLEHCLRGWFGDVWRICGYKREPDGGIACMKCVIGEQC